MLSCQDEVVIIPTPTASGAIGLPVPAPSLIHIANGVDDPNAVYPLASLARFLRFKDRSDRVLVHSIHLNLQIAAILSVVESCRRLKLPVRDYLAAVLPGLADLPVWRLPELTPATLTGQFP
jgi:hypothetical protein